LNGNIVVVDFRMIFNLVFDSVGIMEYFVSDNSILATEDVNV